MNAYLPIERDSMTTSKCPFTRKLSTYVAMSNNDLNTLASFHRKSRSYSSGRELVCEGHANQTVFILKKGWTFSYKTLSDGSRQIVDFHIPGDLLGLRNVLFRSIDHSIEAITPIDVSVVVSGDIINSFGQSPRLATAILWAASRDQAIVAEHLVNLGRRSASERTVHLFLELGARLKLVGLSDVTGFDCPLTQYHLADALGLSAVHVNRVLRDLREEGLMTFRNGRVSYNDVKRLNGFSHFDMGYLDHDGPLLV